MSWEILEEILQKVRRNETEVGKVWLSIILFFRLLMLVVVAEEAFEDEQDMFVCNTQQPGCVTVCYDYFFPVSPIRFWALQFIVVSTPTLLVLVHIASRHARHESEELKGGLLWTHATTALMKFMLECGSVVLYLHIYSKVGLLIPRLLKCSEDPCPSPTDCFVPRAREKTAFSGFMLFVSGMCAFVNLLELLYIPYRKYQNDKSKALTNKMEEDQNVKGAEIPLIESNHRE
uniref:gap junction beta-2 protein-like n=1 Tax=Myxine glutinosa TaxID=7769 RepID=UPI00358E73DA